MSKGLPLTLSAATLVVHIGRPAWVTKWIFFLYQTGEIKIWNLGEHNHFSSILSPLLGKDGYDFPKVWKPSYVGMEWGRVGNVVDLVFGINASIYIREAMFYVSLTCHHISTSWQFHHSKLPIVHIVTWKIYSLAQAVISLLRNSLTFRSITMHSASWLLELLLRFLSHSEGLREELHMFQV